MGLNKAKIYADTPGKKNVIHLNNAGSSLMPQCVLDTQINHLNLESTIGGYEAAAKMADNIDRVYTSVARLINCDKSEIAIVENATVGWAMAFYGIDFKKGDSIITVEAEYVSNYLAYLHMAKIKNVVVDVVPSGKNGEVCLNTLENMIDDKVRLISATHVPTNSGLVNPIEAIGDIARRHNILYLVDACQSAGQMPLDVEEIKCDMLSATSRKYLRGPRGVGFLYVRKSAIEKLHPPIIHLTSAKWRSATEYQLRDDAKRFENWENNYAAKLGFGAAVDYALEIGIENIKARIDELSNYLRNKLAQIDRVTIHAISPHQCGIITFYVVGLDATDIAANLRENGVNTSVSGPESTLLDATKNKLPDLIRASVHYYNDEKELDIFIDKLQQILQK